MTTIEKSVDVRVPVTTAYNQWTQFESFPAFMDGVEKVDQLTGTRTHWRTRIGGATREFDAEITEQTPDERIAWRSVDGPRQNGVVTFHTLTDHSTRVHLRMEYDPETALEKAGTALGVVGHRVDGDLERFKEFIESLDGETGAWRGTVPVTPNTTAADPTPATARPTPVPNPAAAPGPAAPNPLGAPAPTGVVNPTFSDRTDGRPT